MGDPGHNPADDWDNRAYYLHVFDGWPLERIAKELQRHPAEIRQAVDSHRADAAQRYETTRREMAEEFNRTQDRGKKTEA